MGLNRSHRLDANPRPGVATLQSGIYSGREIYAASVPVLLGSCKKRVFLIMHDVRVFVWMPMQKAYLALCDSTEAKPLLW